MWMSASLKCCSLAGLVDPSPFEQKSCVGVCVKSTFDQNCINERNLFASIHGFMRVKTWVNSCSTESVGDKSKLSFYYLIGGFRTEQSLCHLCFTAKIESHNVNTASLGFTIRTKYYFNAGVVRIGQSSRTTAAVVSSPSASLLWSNIFTLSPSSSSSSSDVSVDSQENGGDNMTMMENTFNDYQHPGNIYL